MTVAVNSVGLLGPGLPDWPLGREVLCGERAYVSGEMPRIDLALLPRNERRRTTFTIRLALQVAHEAMVSAGLSSDGVRAVFACSGGDTETLDKICTALSRPERPVSPGQFHNSVHNAPAGYWSIATGSHASSTSLCAYDASFAAGLIEAVTVVLADRKPVLLVAYDTPAPPALLPFRPLSAAFGAALLLTPGNGDEGQARLTVEVTDGRDEDRMADRALEQLRTGNPAARSLPLLKLLASGESGDVVLPYFGASQISVEIEAC